MIAAFLTVSLFVLVLSTVLELYFSFQAQKRSVISEQQLIAESTAGTVRDFVEGKLNSLEQAAEFNSLASVPERRTITLNKLLGQTPSFRQLSLVDAEGRTLEKASRLSGLAPNPLNQFREVLLGAALVGKHYISPVYIDPETSEPLMLIAVPIKDQFHEPVGALAAEMNLKFMWDVIGNIRVGQEGLAYVIDRAGVLIAFRDNSRVLNHEGVAALREPMQFMQNAHDLGADVSRGILGTYVVSGHIALGVPDWAVVVEVPVTEAYASILQTFGYSLLVVIVGSLLAVAIGVYISKRITRGILHLNQAAKAISQGDLDTKIEVLTDNEIGQLGSSFNTMAVRLKELYADMGKNVEEKTGELSRQVKEAERSKSAMLNLLEDERELEDSLKKRTVELETLNERLAMEKIRAEGILRYLRSIGEGVYATDRRGTVVFVNDAAMELIGQKSAELIGGDSQELFRFCVGIDSDSPRLLPTQLALDEARTHIFPHGTFLIRTGHPPLPISGTFAPIIEQDHIAGAIVVFQDITERYELEKMKESFLSVAAHQLRTPLGSMRWSMELLKNGDLGRIPKSAQSALSQLYENSSRMLTIVNDLLNVSRIDQGRAKEEAVSVDMIALLEEVLTTMQGAIEEKGLRLDFHRPTETLPLLHVTRKHVFEALENLVANAVRYNRERGSITIALFREDGDVVVTVADTGIGIPKVDQQKIFSKFFRAANAVKHFTDGSGLGLSVVKSYIEENGGSVAFTSTQDVGTTFTVRLPIEPKKPVILS